MSRVVKRAASQALKSGPSRRDAPLPPFVAALPPGRETSVWASEIKLDGFRMAARIDNGRAQSQRKTQRLSRLCVAALGIVSHLRPSLRLRLWRDIEVRPETRVSHLRPSLRLRLWRDIEVRPETRVLFTAAVC
jgi:hypothetical protein